MILPPKCKQSNHICNLMYHSLTCIGKKRVCVINEDWSESLRRRLEVRGIEVMEAKKSRFLGVYFGP